METKSSTNAKPKRRGLSRRASLSALTTYADDDPSTQKFGFNKKELYLAYKEEKKMRKKEHEKVEAEMKKAIENVKLESVSGLAEETETMITKVNLETFSRPKASRRQRRASLSMTLRILTPPSTPKLELEDITAVEPVPSSPLPVAPLTVDPTDRRAMFQRSFSCEDAEALAGWRTLTFDDGPLGMKLEPTVGDKAARVTGFIDTAGLPSAARATGQIEFNDVIVKINSIVPKSFDETLVVLSEGGIRKITFRPYFDYEIEGLDSRKMKKKKSKMNLFDNDEDAGKHKKTSGKKKNKKSSLSKNNDEEEGDENSGKAKQRKASRIEVTAFHPGDEPKKEKHKKKDKLSKKSSSKSKKKKEVSEEDASASESSASS